MITKVRRKKQIYQKTGEIFCMKNIIIILIMIVLNLSFISVAFAQDYTSGEEQTAENEANPESQDPPPQQNAFTSFLPFILMFAILYFFIIRPQRKKQKELQEMIDNLQVNDKVVTNAGIIGKIVNIKNDKNVFVLRVDDTTGTKIEFQKAAIAGVLQSEKKS